MQTWFILPDLAWPLALLIAWISGEFVHRWTNLPRVSVYGITGFVLAAPQLGLLPVSGGPALLLANVAFGLILFEFGYRINLRWLRSNPWLLISGLVESLATFAAVFAVAIWMALDQTTALLLAALAMSTSPVALLRVINEEKSAGQVSERVLHLAAINCVLAVFTFKVIVGLVVFDTSGSLWEAAYTSLFVIVLSAVAGVVAGAATPAMLRLLRRTTQDATLAFAIVVLLLMVFTHTLKLSPLIAALTFGLVARHRRVMISRAERNFGTLGELLTMFLFVFIAATLSWQAVMAGMAFGLLLIMVRLFVKITSVAAFAHVSGIGLRKGALTGLALAPMSAFVILLLEQTRHLGVNLVDQLAPLAAAVLLLEILGPILTQRALVWAKESHSDEDQHHAP